MSSDASLIASLVLAQTSLLKIGGPILMVLGTVSSLLSLVVFTKKNLRKNPCSIYFIAYNVANFLLIYTSVLLTILAYGYNIDPTSYSLAFCRIRYYITSAMEVLSPSYLILASVDRVLLTSRNALTRRRSTLRLAYISITSITLFWLLIQTHALFLMNIDQIAPGFSICHLQHGIYSIIMTYYTIIFKGILIPLLMVILAIWTIRNVRGVDRVVPTAATGTEGTVINALRPGQSKDRQLLRILLVDISIYIGFTLLPFGAVMYQQVTQNLSKSALQIEILTFFLILGVLSSYVPYCIGCYTNLLVSKTFRHEAKDALMCK